MLRYGYQTGLETLVVHTVNDERLKQYFCFQLTRQTFRLGCTIARLKLKGIDGNPYERWNMWFNSTQLAESYQFLIFCIL
jgi:hypothetical protein